MLLADQPHWYDAAGREGDRRSEKPLGHEDAFSVVAQGAMPKIGHYDLR
jgi:hypothetical protein